MAKLNTAVIYFGILTLENVGIGVNYHSTLIKHGNQEFKQECTNGEQNSDAVNVENALKVIQTESNRTIAFLKFRGFLEKKFVFMLNHGSNRKRMSKIYEKDHSK